MFRPPSLLASPVAPTTASFPTGQPRLLHPGISCFVASARSGYAIRPHRQLTEKGLSPFKICSLVGCSSASLALPTAGSTLPSADFCDTIKVNRFTFSHECVTCRRSPEVSLTAFDAQPPDLQPVPLMDTDFAVICPLVRHRMPQIQFLYIGSRLCSTLLSGPASRRVLFRPCASLSLHVHHVVKRTFTSKRSNIARHTKGRERQRPLPYGLVRGRAITCQRQRRFDRGWTPLSRHQTHRKRRSVHSCQIPGRNTHS